MKCEDDDCCVWNEEKEGQWWRGHYLPVCKNVPRSREYVHIFFVIYCVFIKEKQIEKSMFNMY